LALTHRGEGSMLRFPGFEGLRGWLAWTVVLDHLVLNAGLNARLPMLGRLPLLGAGAVLVFVIISGFVITHLVVERHETYGRYLQRRALRIYPIYLVALLAGALGTALSFATFLHGRQDVFLFPFQASLARDYDSLAAHPLAHWLLHLGLLHGAVPRELLFDSPDMLLPPAWSLSLEWQFYLVAPLVVWAARRKLASIALAIVIDALFVAYAHGRFGSFQAPSFLPGAGLFFAVGIASRLALAPSAQRGSWIALALIALAYVKMRAPLWPLLVWASFLGAALLPAGAGRARAAVRGAFHALFDSRLAKHLGAPAYSTYLLHMPVIQAIQYLVTRPPGLSVPAANLTLVLGTLALTYVLSQVTYRCIELPAIELGKRRIGRQPANIDGAPPTAG